MVPLCATGTEFSRYKVLFPILKEGYIYEGYFHGAEIVDTSSHNRRYRHRRTRGLRNLSTFIGGGIIMSPFKLLRLAAAATWAITTLDPEPLIDEIEESTEEDDDDD